MKPYAFIPGVPAGGHISGGHWHPGHIAGCPKCPPVELTPMFLRPRIQPPAVVVDEPEPDRLDPECTPGWATSDDDGVTAHCGCGWVAGGFPSRRKALAAQRVHRFPPRGI